MPLNTSTYAVPSTREKLAGLPSADAAFGGQANVQNARGLKPPERYQMKLMFERLALEHGLRVNDVVDHYGLHRITYWDWIDTAKPATVELEEKDSYGRIPVGDMIAADQLALLARVRHLSSPIGGNMDLFMACNQVGMTTAQFYALERRKPELERQAEISNLGALNITPVDEQPELADDVARLRVHDAVTILALAARQKLNQAARLLGITQGDVSNWRKTLGFEPVISGNGGRPLPLPKRSLQLDAAGKVRVVRGLEYLRDAVNADPHVVAKELGIHRQSIEAWFRNITALEEEASAAAVEKVVAPEPVKATVVAAPAPEPTPLDPETAALYGTIECADSVMDPARVVELWRTAKGRGANAESMDALVRYYTPAANHAAARALRTMEAARRIDPVNLRDYALPGVWQAIRDHRLGDTRDFMPFARRMAYACVKEELQGDGDSSDIARKTYGKLQGARERWQRRNRTDRQPSVQELAAHMRMSVWEVCDMIELVEHATISLQTPVGEHRDAELISMLDDPSAVLPDYDDAPAETGPALLNGRTEDLLAELPEDREQFLRVFYETGDMAAAAATLGMNEVEGWALHHLLMRRLRTVATGLPQFERMARKFATFGDGRPAPERVTASMMVDLQTAAEFAPHLIEHATRWVPYALTRMSRDELLSALEDIELAPHWLMDYNVVPPQDVNREAFFHAVLLVLQADGQMAEA